MERSPRYPDFLCIGAQKGGTTWLYKNLRNHPLVCMQHKEVNYFNFRGEGVASMMRLPSWQGPFRKRLLGKLFRQPWERSRWYLRYLFRTRTDAWYASLYAHCGDRVTGDVSPAYSTLPEAEVQHVANIMPGAKIILLLRDPVERAWSHARMDFNKGLWPGFRGLQGPIEGVPLDALARHFQSDFSILRGSYTRMLRTWGTHFPPERFFVGFKEEIDRDPLDFIERVAGFLGLDLPGADGWPFVHQRVNAMPRQAMPAAVAEFLSRQYLPELEALEKEPLVQGRPFVSEWRQRAEQRLG